MIIAACNAHIDFLLIDDAQFLDQCTRASLRHKVKEIDIPAQHDASFRMTQTLGNFGLDFFRQIDDIIAEKAVIRLRDSVGLVLEKPFTIVSDADFVVVLKSEDKVLRGFSINNADNAAHCGFLPLPRAFQLGDLHGEVDFLARGKAHEHRQQHQQRSEFDDSVCEHNDWILRFIIRFETCSAKIKKNFIVLASFLAITIFFRTLTLIFN